MDHQVEISSQKKARSGEWLIRAVTGTVTLIMAHVEAECDFFLNWCVSKAEVSYLSLFASSSL